MKFGVYRGIREFRKLARRALAPFCSKIVILLYHRVAEASSDPQLLCVGPGHFGAHLEYLRSNFQIMSLDALVQSLSEKRPPKEDTAVITFDDGYADNLYNAKPLLERYEIPATIFVASGYLSQDRRFWWDELEELLLQPGVLPKTLRLPVDGRLYKWDLGESADYGRSLYQRCRGWNVLEKNNPTPRQEAYRSICQLLYALPEEKRREALTELSTAAAKKPKVDAAGRPFSCEEVVRLAEGRLVEIGAHTATHPILSSCTTAEQETEIFQSKSYLEKLLSRTVRHFSYPSGRPFDYTKKTIEIVRRAGFVSACCSYAGVIWRGSSCFNLPRLLIRDYDIDTFAHRLKKEAYG